MTNKISVKSVEEFMSGYTPTYNPFYPLFMAKAAFYPQEVGENSFKRVEAIGDIRMKRILPKDTEMQQVSFSDAAKTFKKYFFANQFTISALQSNEGREDVVAQVLDENHKLMDDLLCLGEGTSPSNVVNNGLIFSNDPNYVLESSIEIDKGTAADHLKDMHTQIMTTVAKADTLSGQKVLIIYGSTAQAKYDSLYANSDAPFKRVLAEVLESGWTVVKLPSDISLSGNGWVAVNMDQIKLHATVIPTLLAQGVNEEKMYSWHNFLMGSCMVEVLALKGIIRQPVTFEA